MLRAGLEFGEYSWSVFIVDERGQTASAAEAKRTFKWVPTTEEPSKPEPEPTRKPYP